MTNQQKALNLLGIAMRAGKLVTGESLSLKEIQQEQARLVIVAADASDATKEKLTNKCAYYEIPLLIQFTTQELSCAIGRERVICTIMDRGFTKKLKELLT